MHTYDIITREGMEEVLSLADICFVGITDTEGNPYVIPMNYGYADGVLYLHSGPDTHAVDLIRQHSRICATFATKGELVYQNIQIGCSYRMKSKSVICKGNVVFVEDMSEKRKALDLIMHHYTDYPVRYSDPAVHNVCVWKVVVDTMTGKEYAV